MDAESYLHWLKRTDLQTAHPQDLLEAVDAVLEALRQELEEPDSQHARDMHDCLQAVRGELLGGTVPVKFLEEFRIEFDNDPDTYEPPEQVLEQELREIAAGIARERWCTETYEKLAGAVTAFLDGGEEDAFWDVVDEIDALIEKSHKSYSETHILPKERTLESVVVHKLLIEGMEDWKSALDSLRDEEEPDWDWILESAERGNRLLVAVQIFYERVQNALV